MVAAGGESRGGLATLSIGQAERRIARGAVVLFVVGFAAIIPFASVPLGRSVAFIAAQQTSLSIIDLITAVLLFSQFATLHRRGLLALASGYLFTAAMCTVHMVTYPGLFTLSGLLHAGPQTTAWLFMFWHAGFPLAVIGYALLEHGANARESMRAPATIVIATDFLAVGAAVVILTLLATKGHAVLPEIMRGDTYTSVNTEVGVVLWLLPLAALCALWMKWPRSSLDLWLAVVMCAWLIHIALGVVFNTGRFELGYYAGRIYGLAAGGFVLAMLIVENTQFYVRLERSLERERAERDRQLHELQAELMHVSRVSELGHMASGLAHEVNQPLAAASNYLAASLQFARTNELATVQGLIEKAAAQITRASAIVRRARQFARKREPERHTERLAGVLEDAASLALAAASSRRIDLKIRLHDDEVEVFIDRVQVQQVLVNLVRNAIEAMAHRSRCEISIITTPTADCMIQIGVSDTGAGLAPDIRARLFQPFTTTKADGMGIGLSICRSIVEAHGGRMWATDNPGGGTVFHFTLPLEPLGTGA